jgi:hypothetical protein
MTLWENAHIEERAVTIKVLRVGTKQLTSTLFKQIARLHPIDIQTGQLTGTLWGQVTLPDHEHKYVLWEKEAILFRYLLDRIEKNAPVGKLKIPALSQNSLLRKLHQTLREKDILLSFNEQGKLSYEAPKDAMTSDLVQAIKEHRDVLRDVLAQEKAYRDVWQSSYQSIVEQPQLFIGV